MIISFRELPESIQDRVKFSQSFKTEKSLQILGFQEPRKLSNFKEAVINSCIPKTFVKEGRSYYEISNITKVK